MRKSRSWSGCSLSKTWGQELYFDGTKVAANAGKESLKPRFFVEAHLSDLLAQEAKKLPRDQL